ncbi:MAG: M20 family metallopeptidase [Nitrospinota bacterium]
MIDLDRRIEAFSRKEAASTLELLERLVTIQSGTTNKAGVDAVVAVMARELEALGFALERHRREDFGDHLVARRGPDGTPPVLLVGHTDTVYPPEEPAPPFRMDGDRCLGQGVIDMKGGLACMVSALRALETTEAWGEGAVAVLLNSDEEVGSVDSGPLRDALGRGARCALVLECGGREGEVVAARRGQRALHLQVEGRARHAGSRDPLRANAIHELAHQIVALEGLTDLGRGRSVNVGRVTGGIGANTLAARAEAWVDVRYLDEEDGAALRAEMEAIVAGPQVEGCRSSLRATGGRPAWAPGPATERLLAVVQEAARGLGRSVVTEHRWGVSDANNLAELGVAVLDGLGPMGGNDHTPDEYCWVASLTERSALLGATLARLLADPTLP